MFAQESVMDIQEKQALQKLINEMHDVTGMWSVEQMVTHVWQAAKAQAVPEGFVLVPKEPTDAMLFAASARDIVAEHYGGENILWPELRETWKAMIEAQEPAND